MRVALHDSDKTSFPNLALMRISAWHKLCGDTVEWFVAGQQYDKVYSSKVFTFTEPEPALPSDTVKGGTGYDLTTVLPNYIEACYPDYSLYGIDYSLGFLTRGCPRRCSWCFVHLKEGDIRPAASVSDILLPGHKSIVLMDNNVLACDHGIQQIEELTKLPVKVDFNQGLDARLIDDPTARLLAKLKWSVPLRLSCDSVTMMEPIRKAVEALRWFNATPRQYFCYVLCRDPQESLEIVRFLKGIYVDPFLQPYIPLDGSMPTKEQRRLARWTNTKMLFKGQLWEDYQLDRGNNI